MRRLAYALENVRTLLGGKPLLISSAFRSATVNKAVGGASNSAHALGLAADFICPAAGTPLQICTIISRASSIPFDQLIYEGTWVHYAIPARDNDSGKREVLTAHFGSGTTKYPAVWVESDATDRAREVHMRTESVACATRFQRFCSSGTLTILTLRAAIVDVDHCRICGNTSGNRTIIAKELMLGLHDAFDYLECSCCGCLQIKEMPHEIGRYYPKDYYSYRRGNDRDRVGAPANPVLMALRKVLLERYLTGGAFVGRILSSKFRRRYPWIRSKSISRRSRILDVGCGSGELLLKMYTEGFENLSGVDPFIEGDIRYPCGVFIEKREIHELTGRYDFIMLHHSFEHMAEPMDVLGSLHRILQPTGQVILRIPLVESHAWRKYGVHWVQLDAPRHFFLHTVRSIQLLCDKAGFELADIEYDSGTLQFIGSERYLKGLPLVSGSEGYSRKQRRAFKAEARRLNALRDGDSACFYLRKKL